MKKFLLLSMLALVPCISHAAPNPDKLSICYLFDKNEELVSRGACILSTGYGAGGIYTAIDYNNKEYLFESTIDDEENIYYRNSFYYRHDGEYYDGVITCHHHKPYDVCYLW